MKDYGYQQKHSKKYVNILSESSVISIPEIRPCCSAQKLVSVLLETKCTLGRKEVFQSEPYPQLQNKLE